MQQINPGDVVTYTEYEQSPLSGRKRVRQRMENMLVEAVIHPGEVLARDRLAEYFGEDLSGESFRALSSSPVLRLILKEDDGAMHCVNLVESFLRSGMQSLEIGVGAVPEPQDAPSYLNFLNAFGGAAGE